MQGVGLSLPGICECAVFPSTQGMLMFVLIVLHVRRCGNVLICTAQKLQHAQMCVQWSLVVKKIFWMHSMTSDPLGNDST